MNLQKAIKDNIDQHGWHLQYVFGDEARKSKPFFYTIGLTDMGLPEMILVGGIPTHYAHAIISDLMRKWKGEGFKNETRYDIIGTSTGAKMPVEIAELYTGDGRLRSEYAIQAFEYYKGQDIRFAQILWPDREGNLPSSAEFAMHDLTEVFPIKVATMQA